MDRDLHPTGGARYLLELDAALDDGHRARYRATIFTPTTAFATTATLADDGAFELAPSGAPDELHARLASITKLIARDASRLRADGMPPWPQRILRWRR